MADNPNPLSEPLSEENHEQAEVYSVQRDRDGALHFSRKDFLAFGLAVGGALLVKGVCPRFGTGEASPAAPPPAQAGMMPVPKIYIHSQPRIDSNILDTLQQNDVVRLVADHPDLGWMEVTTQGEKQGWLKRVFVDFSRAMQRGSEVEYQVHLPMVMKAPDPSATEGPTPTPKPSATPCPTYTNPCGGHLVCPGNAVCPPVDSCPLYVIPCYTNSVCPPVNDCPLYYVCSCNSLPVPCTCNAFPCTCNYACPCNSLPVPCSCDVFPCTCNFACTCNSMPCSCNALPCFTT